MEERVVLVDTTDQQIGTEEKIKAHKEAKLHRAFSVFVFNSKGEILLQQRAASKYHGGGLWSNACCSHPREGETVEVAAHRKLQQEMGFDTELKKMFDFIYKVPFENGLWEHEFDHVLIGRWDGSPQVNLEEVQAWKWVSPEELKQDVAAHPKQYTEWFKIVLEKVLAYQS